jgi:hypothetical protein
VPHDEPHEAHGPATRRHERPEDWGWHGEFPRVARLMGWLSAALLASLSFTNRYDRTSLVWLLGVTALLVLLLLVDWYRRKNAWRS